MRTALPIALIAVATLGACASKPQVPPPQPDASSAAISDTSTVMSRSGGTFFSVEKIDGMKVENNLTETRKLTFGQGVNLRVATVSRKVPAGKVKLQLAGNVAKAAPILELIALARDRLHSVSGAVELELEPGKRYFVNGVLDELRREVWLEEQGSRRIIGAKVIGAPSDEAIKAMAAEPMFTCCNLHYDEEDDNWISDANWMAKPFIPAGTPIKVYEIRKDRAKAMIRGAPMWLGLDYGRKKQTVRQFVSRLAVKEDPMLRLESYSAPMQRAIRSAKIAIGMTQQQLLMSIGYPIADLTASLDAPTWVYLNDDEKRYSVRWDSQGRVADVEADARTRRLVIHIE